MAEGIDLVDFNYPQHLGGLKPEAVTGALKAAGLAAGAVAVRFPASTFRAGAFTNPDPSVRAAAVDIVAAACGWARLLDASAGVIVWPQFDGYDYHMQINYTTTWRRGVDAIRAALDRDECEGVKLSYEFKPTDPSSRFALVPSTAAALTLVSDVDRPGRFGLTLDAGHLVAAGENPAQSAAMVADAGVLFGFHLGDVHSKLAAEDGLAFGSVHAAGALELVYWLRASYGSAGGYAGYAYFDTFPEAEDPTREAAYNVRAFKRMWRWAARLENDGIRDVLLNHDAMTSLEMQEGLIA
jgi:sugar phosphate isomerase/epimerase